MIVFEKLSQPLAANYKWDVGIAGNYFRLAACPWPVTVQLLKNQQVIGQMANMMAGDYVEGVEFDKVSIVNGAMAQTVDVQISGGGAGSDRVLGEVSIIDGGRSRTLAGMAFIGTAGVAGVAGQYPHIQLFNPAASGKNVIVESLVGTVATAGFVQAFGHSVALAALVGGAPSKRVGAAASTAELRTLSAAGAVGVGQLLGATLQANSNFEFALAEPVVLVPGTGLLFRGALAGDLSVTVEFFEEAV